MNRRRVTELTGRLRSDRGSAVAEYAMVYGLVVLLCLTALQVGITLYIRNTLIADAAEGARYGARADSSPGLGAARTRELIRANLRDSYADQVAATRVGDGGADVVRVTVIAPFPVLGPWGPGGQLKVSARAYAEDQ